jgi:hypothetical protein
MKTKREIEERYSKYIPIVEPCGVNECGKPSKWNVDAIDPVTRHQVHTTSCGNREHKKMLMDGAVKLVQEEKKKEFPFSGSDHY